MNIKIVIVMLLLCMSYSYLTAGVNSTSGIINFDVNSDGVHEASLSSTGLKIGTGNAFANLDVTGNSIITGELIVGGTSNTSLSNLHIHGTLGFGMITLTSGANALPNSSMVLADTSAGNVLIQMPNTATTTRVVTIKRTSLLNNVFINSPGASIDEASTLLLGSGNLSSVSLVLSNSVWYVTNSFYANAQEIAASDMFLYWKLDETSGSSASDSCLHSRTGTLSHSFGGNSVDGARSTGLLLTSSSDNVIYSGGGLPTAAYTYCLWTQSSVSSSTTLDYEPEISGNAGFVWSSGNSDDDGAAYHQLSDGTYVECTSGTTFSANTWYHLGVTWNGSDLSLYVNGSLSSNVNAPSWTGGSNLSLDHPGTMSSSNVAHDDLRFFSRALTVDEVNVLYQAGAP